MTYILISLVHSKMDTGKNSLKSSEKNSPITDWHFQSVVKYPLISSLTAGTRDMPSVELKTKVLMKFISSATKRVRFVDNLTPPHFCRHSHIWSLWNREEMTTRSTRILVRSHTPLAAPLIPFALSSGCSLTKGIHRQQCQCSQFVVPSPNNLTRV